MLHSKLFNRIKVLENIKDKSNPITKRTANIISKDLYEGIIFDMKEFSSRFDIKKR